jgi:hypothetical protein
MISFVTCIKLMPGYEDFESRLHLYVESIQTHCKFPYEILIVEDVNEKNIGRIKPINGVQIIEYNATYSNPHGYNMIEAFSKNAGIQAAKYPFICVTNCDIIFTQSFFDYFESNSPTPKTFYRFLEYDSFEATTPINPIPTNPTLNEVAYKSGDIMMLDAESWRKIRGYPENEVWVHSDLIVCKVAHNNGFRLEIPPVRIITPSHGRRESPPSLKRVEHETSYAYFYRVECNSHLDSF